jgi:hypothetical protein
MAVTAVVIFTIHIIITMTTIITAFVNINNTSLHEEKQG